MAERKTKIIATMGPATDSRKVIEELVTAGVDVARLNFSHGDHETHSRISGWVREVAQAVGRPVALLQDIQGPKIRLGTFDDGSVELADGSTVELRAGKEVGTSDLLYIDYPHLIDDLGPGQPVLLVDGLVRLEVLERIPAGLRALVAVGGVVRDQQGAAFPGADLQTAAVTDKDRLDLEFGRSLGVDFVAASFVRNRKDIEEVQRLAGSATPVIAKIELATAYANLDDILAAADGAMVARGDLGVEVPLEQLPRVQAEILSYTNRAGDISITATEMLESMTTASRPTRAEVSDVAAAVLEGSDAVMLSGETAVGRHPALVVAAMDSICRETERGPRHQAIPIRDFLRADSPVPSATTRAAVEAAASLDLRTIIAFTESGETARLLSKYRPEARIVAFTPEEKAYRRMALYWGVEPRALERFSSTDEMLAHAEARLVAESVCDPGETVVMVAGIPPNQRSSTNFLKLHEIGAATGVG